MSDVKEKDTSRSSKVIPCTCIHEFQDAKYGRGNRVHNWARSGNNKIGGWRCTVCKTMKPK